MLVWYTTELMPSVPLMLHCGRALGWFLLAGRGRAEMDAQQWQQDAQEKQQRVMELEQEFSKAQEQLQQQISAAKVQASHAQ